MKKEFIVHFAFLVAFFLLISIYKTVNFSAWGDSASWFTLNHLVFWIGGVFGVILVYIDHFIYAYFLRPNEQSSQEAKQMVSGNQFLKATRFLVKSHLAIDNLIFHNAQFQSVFLVFGFFVLTSSDSLLGRGIVLGFLVHLLVDMVRDLTENKTFDKWFARFPVVLTPEQKRWYLGFQVAAIFVLGMFF